MMHNQVTEILNISIQQQLIETEKLANELLFDLEQNQYTFIVVGEFSTGKSSFINALIGQSILPVGITPTTATINILKYGDDAATVYYKDGHVEQTNEAQLNDLIANKLEQADTIDYVVLQKKLDFLKDDMIIIDTPGLNDLNEARVDVTYNYIPRADVVLFLLDCRTPLRKTEFEYITEALLKNGLDRIIFIANFADDVPEEELDGIIQKIERQLLHALDLSTVTVIPFSAHEALEGKQLADAELLDISGYNQVMTNIEELCESGSRVKEKQIRMEHRLNVLEQTFKYELTQQKQLLLQSEDELKETLENMANWQHDQHAFSEKFHSYYEERIFDFKRMANKSIETFFEELKEEVMEKVDLYQGTQIQHYFEKELPSYIKKRLKHWIERYNPKIHILLGKLEVALTGILEEKYKGKVSLSYMQDDHTTAANDIQISVQKPLDPNITSGLVVGGAGVLFLALGGGLLLPIIGMAGLPMLQKMMHQKNLNIIKPQVKDELQAKLLEIEQQFSIEIEQYIQSSGQKIYDEIYTIYERKMAQQEQLIRQRLHDMQTDHTAAQSQLQHIQQYLIEMEEV
ncbi:dynamin family protein (plasmid) [Lysinibacillus capsici]|uniref:dynamin family protein n=1 Tax=Lysinibacillus TaxID=400634 RepID=UPI0021D929DF|nr:dynamin family protein [Lysinibacillus capsici]UYB50094.1 dynamin family protein [Lysinibacillus capsici]